MPFACGVLGRRRSRSMAWHQWAAFVLPRGLAAAATQPAIHELFAFLCDHGVNFEYSRLVLWNGNPPHGIAGPNSAKHITAFVFVLYLAGTSHQGAHSLVHRL